MNNAVKEYAVKNNAARMKELFLKLRYGTYLIAALTILGKSTHWCPLIKQ